MTTPPSAGRSETLRELRLGWKTLLGAMIGFGVGSGLYPVYVVPTIGAGLEAGFGWTRTESASLITAALLGGIVGLPIVGWLADRIPPRAPAVASMLATAVFLAIAAVIPPDPLVWRIGAFLFGFFGAGCLAPTFAKALCLDFNRARGLAMGFTMGAVGLSGAVFAPVLQDLIGRFGVPQTMMALSVVYFVVFVPLTFLLLPSRRPPRAESPPTKGEGPAGSSTPYGALLLLGLATVLISLAANSGAAHLVPLMKDAQAASPASAASVMALTVMISRPVAGALMDRFPANFVGAVAFLASAAGLALVAGAGVDYVLFGAFLIGLAVGAEADIIAYLTSRYVPAAQYARSYTWLYVALILTAALGPLGVAMLRDWLGDYTLTFGILAVGALGAAVLLLLLPRYQRHAAESVGATG